jgi:hypothetical protein
MFGSKIYTNKIPKTVRLAMHKFTNAECILVKRKDNDFAQNAALNCHQNVATLAEELNGEMKNGWLLYRSRMLMNMGVWVWCFHSVLKTAENKLIDVTKDKMYETNNYSTFWYDTSRTANVQRGTAYNNIMVIDNQRAVDLFNAEYGCDLKVGVVYWTSNCMRFFKKLNEHNGVYKALGAEYEQNLTELKQEQAYGTKSNIDLLFDYNLSMH